MTRSSAYGFSQSSCVGLRDDRGDFCGRKIGQQVIARQDDDLDRFVRVVEDICGRGFVVAVAEEDRGGARWVRDQRRQRVIAQQCVERVTVGRPRPGPANTPSGVAGRVALA